MQTKLTYKMCLLLAFGATTQKSVTQSVIHQDVVFYIVSIPLKTKTISWLQNISTALQTQDTTLMNKIEQPDNFCRNLYVCALHQGVEPEQFGVAGARPQNF